MAAFALVVALGGPNSFGARADDLPDWAAPIVASAPAVDGKVQAISTRTLFNEIRVTVFPDGTRSTRQRTVSQILNPVDRIHVSGFPLPGSARMKVSKAWHVPPGEKAQASTLPPADISGPNFITDARARLLGVSGSKRGSLVVFEFELLDTPPALGWSFDFYDDAPIDLSRFELVTPPDWAVRSAWLRCNPPPRNESEGDLSWELRSLPSPQTPEPYSELATETSPILVVNVEPPMPVPAGNAMPDWRATSVWYDRLAQGRAAVTPAIRIAAHKAWIEAAAGSAAETSAASLFDKVRAEARLVRDSVRYLDVAVGIGAIQPHSAADTLSNLYGDCKDKATLLIALLASEGVQAHGLLINATKRNNVHPTIPAPDAFNHMITAIPIPKEVSAPAWAAEAIVDAGDLGRLLIVDTTREECAIGSLPFNLAGKQGLVLAGERGRLVTLPSGQPGTHRIERSFATDVHADRSLDVTMVARFTGEPAAVMRILQRQSQTEMRKVAERRGTDAWADADPKDFSVQPETPEGVFVEEVKWAVPTPPPAGPEGSIPLFPGAGLELPRVNLAGRSAPVVIGFPQTLRYETTVTGLPAEAPLPDSRTLKGEAWSVATTYVREGTALRATWEMRLSKERFTQESFADLKKLYVALRATADESLPLP